MLIESLQNVLAQDAGMQGFLGTPSTRPDSSNGIWPTQAPDGPTMPYLVLNQVSGQPLSTSMQGTGRRTNERWRFSFYGTTYKNAKRFAKQGRQFLIGLFGPQPAGNAEISGAWVKREADDTESLGTGTLFSTHVDIEFEYYDGDSYQ